MKDRHQFDGKVVVITGAGSGIGRAVANLFAAHGANLALADKNEKRLREVQSKTGARGVQVMAEMVDVSDRQQVKALSDSVLEKFGRVDVLVNNAGIGWAGPCHVFPMEDFEQVMAVNFWGVVYGIDSFLPAMKRQGSGHIVNVSSSAGLNGIAPLGAYSASKHAVAGYSEVLRAELSRFNIGVTAICPGIINTSIVRDGKATMTADMRVSQDQMVDFYRKWGWPPERVARAIMRAVEKNRGVVPVGPEAWLFWYMKRTSQRLWEAYLRQTLKLSFRRD